MAKHAKKNQPTLQVLLAGWVAQDVGDYFLKRAAESDRSISYTVRAVLTDVARAKARQ